jgi:DNA ligase D-like protein (predicted polymerase)
MQRVPARRRGQLVLPEARARRAPDWLQTTIVSTPNGTTSRALVLADMAHVVWAVNLACLGFHVWPNRTTADVADELRLDLDPQPGVELRRGTRRSKRAPPPARGARHRRLPKTTGNRGLHVYVRLEPRWDSYQVRSAAVAAARELERRHPDLITAAWWKEERGRRVFLDFNQNAPHKTVFGAWSVRARPGAQVSAPLTWEEVDTLHPDELTIATVPALLAARGDPWEDDGRAAAVARAAARAPRAGSRRGLMDAPWPPSTRSSRTSRRASRPAVPASSER